MHIIANQAEISAGDSFQDGKYTVDKFLGIFGISRIFVVKENATNEE